MRVVWISIHSRFYASISILNILKGSFQPKLKGANVWPFNARGKVAIQAESVIYDHCTGTVKRKLIKVNCCDNLGQFYVPGRAGPVFRLDRISILRLSYTI